MENIVLIAHWYFHSSLFPMNDTDVQSKRQGLTLLNGEQYNLEGISL